MIYPKNFESRIGFDVIRKEIEKRCISSLGSDYCARMQMSVVKDDIVLKLSQTNEFLSILQSKKEFPVNYFFDMRLHLKGISAPGTFITPDNLFNLRRSLATVGEIVNFFAVADGAESPYPCLAALASGMWPFRELLADIDRVIDKFGNVKDSASPHLRELRQQIASSTSSINGIMRRIIANGRQNGIFDNDTAPSVRDGRLVLPVSPMNKRKVRGIVHDESASGKTIFIEPEEIVEANNRIRETEAEIKREIVRILIAISDTIRPHIDELNDTYSTLGLFDFIRAKAVFATDIDAQMPHIDGGQTIEWYHAVHPALFLALKEQGKQVVPLNIELNRSNRILIISGPNAGGKSVCLKTVGVVQYMMQCGILPPLYSNSHMGIFSNIFIDIGDQQSIEDDLSTYSSHLQNMKTFLSRGNDRTLVLIDEFGSGTEPQIGGAIAQAILEQLNNKRMMGVITTHYQNLKHFADDTEGLVNGAMLYDRQHMQPLFQLSVGYPGSSFAIEIARKIGLPSQVIDKATEIVGTDYINMDKYLLDIVRDRRYWENKRRDVHAKEKRLDSIINDYNTQIDTLSKEHRSIINEAKKEAKEILKQSNREIERTIKEIKEVQADKERTKEARKKLSDFNSRQLDEGVTGQSKILNSIKPKHNVAPKRKPAAQQPKAVQDRPIAEGDNVTMADSSTVGSVMSIDGKWATVAFGALKTKVEVKRLKRTIRKAERSQTVTFIGKQTSDEIRLRQLSFKQEIDVRGMRADEALQAVTYFIDDAVQFNARRVRILHGTGTGVLREVIRQYLNTVAGVKSYHDEHVQLGGAGITVVELE